MKKNKIPQPHLYMKSLYFCEDERKDEEERGERFCLNIRKHFFSVRVTKCWHTLHRDIVEPSSLEIFKSHWDTVLDNLL